MAREVVYAGGLASSLRSQDDVQLTLAVPVAGLLAGAAFGVWWPAWPGSWLVAALGGWLLLARHAHRTSQPVLLAVSVCGAFAAGGAVRSMHAWQQAWRPSLRLVFEAVAHDARLEAQRAGRLHPEDDEARLVVSGVLRADASASDTGAVSLPLDVEWASRGVGNDGQPANPVNGGVLLSVLGEQARAHRSEWRAGRRIQAPADLRRVARYLDPGVPDQERAAARRGVTLVGTVKSAALVDVIARGSFVEEACARVRAVTRAAVADAVGRWSPRAAGIVTAIIIGDRSGLEPAVVQRLQEAGTYHVIAISGGNVAILAGLTLWVFRVAGMLGRVATLSAATGLVAYGVLVGGGASVDRAVLMAVVYFVGLAWDLRSPPFQGLVLAAGLLVLWDPLLVADPSSLLTFGATAAIVAGAALIDLRGLPPGVAPLFAMLAASCAAEVALLPVAATFFSRVTVAGLLLNFGAIPLMAVAQLAGMALVPLWPVWPSAARVAGWVAYVGAEGLVRTANLVTLAPWAAWRVAEPAVWSVVAYYVAGGAAWVLWRRLRGLGKRESPGVQLTRRTCTLAAVVAGVWIASPAWTLPLSGGDGRLHVTFIDVGQGDSALLTLPRGQSLLIDAGGLGGAGPFDIGDRVVAPVLRGAGVRRLSMLALTHGDADHVGGAASVLREFRPWDVWDGVPVPPFEPLQRLRVAALAAGTRWTSVQRADSAVLDDVRVVVHHPAFPDWERQDVRNDDSIVIEFRWRDVSLVFTGDIGRDAEADIASRFTPAPLRVLKVPHHGSQTSSSPALLAALRPDIAVVSVGRSNHFGHPSPPVLERYRAAGTALFRTDQDGAVMLDTDGYRLAIHTVTGRVLSLRAGHPERARASP